MIRICPLFVAARHQLEEEMGGIGLEGQIAELVDDQQLGSGKPRQLLVECSVIVGLGEHRHQRRSNELD